MANNPRSPRRNSLDEPPTPSDQSTCSKKQSDFRKPTFWVNVVTLIVIAVYTCFACNQVQQTQTANSIAKKALTEVNKPYVMFTGLVPNYTSDNAGQHFRIGAAWTNLGNTPAQYIRAWNCDPIIRDDIVPPVFTCHISESEQPYSVLGPKQGLGTIGPVIKESDFEATADEKKAIYIFGYVEYQDSIDTDAVGNPEQRTTRFCQRVIQPKAMVVSPSLTNPSSPPTTTVIDPPPGAPITAIGALGCNGFICMDDTCKALK